MKLPMLLALAASAPAAFVTAVTIAQINGDRFLSPLRDRDVANVTGLVTAASKTGIYLRSTVPDDDPATSEGLFVFGNSSAVRAARVGDVVTLSGRVKEYRSNKDYIYLTELTDPSDVVVVSSGHAVAPLVVGRDTLPPPTRDFSGLDAGGVFGVPNAAATVSGANPRLDPAAYGLDFWESLVGELVTLRAAYLTSRPNQYGDVWVRGDWAVTGVNAHGGVTMLDGDANPETIVVGTPLDGSANPTDTKMGDFVGDVTGVVSNAFGFYRILPLTRLVPLRNASADFPATSLASRRSCRGITVADYNAENLAPNSAHLPRVVDQIVNELRLPDLVFLQEVQDGSGAVNDGVVSANLTLSTLVRGIEAAAPGVTYAFAEVEPQDGKDGGQPGGNIRCAYLYRPDVVELHEPRQGGSLDANEVLPGPALKLNPGRIQPASAAFDDSRKPVAAAWRTVRGTRKPFFTVNVHFGSKGGSTTLHGDARPPVNKGVDKRTEQTTITADFIAAILKQDPAARVIAAGDFNEFTQVQPMRAFAERSGLRDLDELAGLAPEERYTYLFDMNSQALDHMYVSPALARGARVEHLHVNTWQNFKGQTSDHDPSVALLNVCGCA
ncbi:hypothetical protein JDV02_004572 [Purpureocillium takamizusanense]|uniref:Endonuclease/exonuclease/phosphatase domain-containing protein n=1 Tax=Purpureocillium takamizusanense TaxID=2060973 RepID=A0A9Q8QFK8_9HYPO|nr:uncharacterized protein JDV02_004572 [Purpureocillium takamizusanense]UNI18296.1 hypothetical protein JDV02_004572 [Purpureocillium takamizusanense]